MAKLAGAAGGSGAGAAGAGGFSAGAGASGALGSSAFGGAGEGAAGAAGLTGTASTFAAPASSYLGAIGSFARDVFNPSQGLAGQQVAQQLGQGGAPNMGDLATYVVQQLLNQELQRGAGPAFTPMRAVAVQRPRPLGPAKIHPQGD